MFWILAVAVAGPMQEARTALADFGPHTAVYHKRSTGKPVLEIAYRGPREATLRALSPEGTFVVAVDERAIYTRLDEKTCARLDARSIFEQARFAGLDLLENQGPPGSRLLYHVRPDAGVELAGSFAQAPDPPLFSWLEDLEADGVEVKVRKKSWEATSSMTSWTVRREDGLLQQMDVGGDALELADVQRGEPPASQTVCPATTDPALGQVLTAQLRLAAAVPAQSKLAEAWKGLDDERRALARRRQTDGWRLYFQDEIPGWLASLQGGDWQQVLLARLANQERFAAFVAGLPAQERRRAVERWQQLSYAEFGRQLVGAHLAEVHATLRQTLGQAETTWDPEVQRALLDEPMEQALLAEVEQPLQAMLVPLLKAGAADLQPPE